MPTETVGSLQPLRDGDFLTLLKCRPTNSGTLTISTNFWLIFENVRGRETSINLMPADYINPTVDISSNRFVQLSLLT
jgi:hypothetical protein